MVLALGIGVTGCGVESTTTPTTPTTSMTITPTTELFTGTVSQLGSSTNPFTVSVTGSVKIQLTSVAPLATMALGVEIGTWNGTICTTITKNDNARSGTTALTGTAAAGSYCVNVYDSGNIPEASSVDYTIQVLHP
jgi:hypothetical protein